ncbi:hypothetical protein [Leptospira noguchii]|nr:hypothetical protein [Leptospira noguchii]UOG54921.1 hypothetical protein MAL09_20165 [Leptospira noguchii]
MSLNSEGIGAKTNNSASHSPWVVRGNSASRFSYVSCVKPFRNFIT